MSIPVQMPLPPTHMTPGPRDPSMLKHMINGGRIPSGGSFRPDMMPPRTDMQQMSPPPPLDVSTLSTGPLSVRVNGGPGCRLNMSPVGGGSGGSVSPGNSGSTSQTTRTTPLDQSRDQSSSHVTDLSNMSHLSHLSPIPPEELSRLTSKRTPPRLLPKWVSFTKSDSSSTAAYKWSLTSLVLLSLLSLLLALMALTFLVKLDLDNGNTRRSSYFYQDSTVLEVTLALTALVLALNLCCLLVCSAQFVFAIKLFKTDGGEERLMKYLQKLSVSRKFATGSFFISIPLFSMGVGLYLFSRFEMITAVLISVLIGSAIIICGLVLIKTVFIWQQVTSKSVVQENIVHGTSSRRGRPEMNSSPLPNATLDLSRTLQPHELSTLV